MLRQLVALLTLAAATAQHDAGPKPVGATLFQWPFVDIGRECAWLGQQGYGWVLTSPVQAHIDFAKNGDRPWWIVYQPLNFGVGNRLGSEADFDAMVAACRAAGVGVLVDVVLNHGPYGSTTSTACFGCTQKWDATYRPGAAQFSMPEFGFNIDDTHAGMCTTSIGGKSDDWQNPWTLHNCPLETLVDWDTAKPKVRAAARTFLARLLEKGVTGFRVDAAKHIHPDDLAPMLAGLQTREGKPPLVTLEVLHGFPDRALWQKYMQLGRPWDFDYSYVLGEAFNGNGNLIGALQPILTGTLPTPASIAISLIENHDSERSPSNIAGSSRPGARAYKQAVAFNVLWAYGAPAIHSGYWFPSRDAGPPANATGYVLGPGNATNNTFRAPWAGQHRWAEIFPLVAARNWMYSGGYKGLPTIRATGPRHIYWSVPGRVFVAINADARTMDATLPTDLPPGRYCNTLYARAVNGTCQLLPGVVLNGEAATYDVAPDGRTRIAIKPTDKSQVVVLTTEGDKAEKKPVCLLWS